MELKYKLGEKHPTANLYRVISLRDFGNVKAGDIGGYVGSEKNLSHEGKCWIYGDAKVYGNASVYGDARVYGNARVFGNARVYGNAIVFGDARVYGNAEVCKSKHTTKVKSFILSRHTITIDGEYLNIGCKSLKMEEWLKDYVKIGKENGYTDEEIKEYGAFIKTINKTYFK